jgi:O-antigen ligase
LARLLLAATLFGAPLSFGAVVPWGKVALGLGASVALFLWAFAGVRQGAFKLSWSPLYIPLTLFFLLGVAQYGVPFALDRSETRQALVLLAADLTFFFLATQLFAGADGGPLCAFGLAVVVYAGAMGLFSILQLAASTHGIYAKFAGPWAGLWGPYVNRDHFAGLMEMLIPVGALYGAGYHRRFSLQAWLLPISAVMLAFASLLLTGSRGGLLALSAEVAIFTFAFRRATVDSWRQGRRLVMVAAIALLAGLMLFAYVDPGSAAERWGVVAHPQSWGQWIGSRETMARDALRMWRDHPLLGVGLGNLETAYPRYQTYASDDWVDHAHNDYAEAFAETGLIGALLILFALALFLRLAFRDGWRAFGSLASRIRLGAAIACCGMLVHSLGDFNLHIPANAAWFACLAGIATTARAD